MEKGRIIDITISGVSVLGERASILFKFEGSQYFINLIKGNNAGDIKPWSGKLSDNATVIEYVFFQWFETFKENNMIYNKVVHDGNVFKFIFEPIVENYNKQLLFNFITATVEKENSWTKEGYERVLPDLADLYKSDDEVPQEIHDLVDDIVFTQAINHALDNGDKELFMQLTNERKGEQQC